jgi:hypothetical protein
LLNTIKNINKSFSHLNGPDKRFDSSECLLMSFGIFKVKLNKLKELKIELIVVFGDLRWRQDG